MMPTFEKILSRIPGGAWPMNGHDGVYLGKCPCHGPDEMPRPALSIQQIESGRVALHCMDQEHPRADILAALGFTDEPPAVNGNGQPPDRGHVAVSDEGQDIAGPEGQREAPATGFAPVRLDDFIARTPDKRTWLWEGFLPQGAFALFSGFMKSGKTTLIYELIKSLASGELFLGCETQRSKILVLALEENPVDINCRLRGLDIKSKDQENIFIHAAPARAGGNLLQEVKKFIVAHGVKIIVVDTLPRLLCVKDENSNAEVLNAVSPILDLTRELDISVLAVVHESKTGGQHGRGIRGASSLFGLADIAISLERRPGGSATQRSLKTSGRFPESPDEIVIDYQEGRYKLIGDPSEARDEDVLTKVKEALADGGPLGIKDLEDATGLPTRRLKWALTEMVNRQKADRMGDGKRGNPHVFTLKG